MFSWYKYLIVGLVFSRLGFWSGNLFLIAPFPDLCLLVPFSELAHIGVGCDLFFFSVQKMKNLLANKFNILIVLLKIWIHVNEHRQSMFWIKIKKIMNTLVNPSFTNKSVV